MPNLFSNVIRLSQSWNFQIVIGLIPITCPYRLSSYKHYVARPITAPGPLSNWASPPSSLPLVPTLVPCPVPPSSLSGSEFGPCAAQWLLWSSCSPPCCQASLDSGTEIYCGMTCSFKCFERKVNQQLYIPFSWQGVCKNSNLLKNR